MAVEMCVGCRARTTESAGRRVMISVGTVCETVIGNPPGRATTRMAARPSRFLQRNLAAPSDFSKLRSAYHAFAEGGERRRRRSALLKCDGGARGAHCAWSRSNFKRGLRLERETGIEPATSSLGSSRSTAELLPLSCTHCNSELSPNHFQDFVALLLHQFRGLRFEVEAQ